MNEETLLLETTKLAFTFAKDFSIQLITVATAIIGLTVTLAKDVMKHHKIFDLLVFFAIVGSAFLSVISGVFCLMALTGSLVPVEGKPDFLISGNTRFYAVIQLSAFLAAIAFFVFYGAKGAVRLMRQPATP